MRVLTLFALVSAIGLALPLSGCCGSCGDALQTPDGRKTFIESLNGGNKDCTIRSVQSELTEVTRTCKSAKIAEMVVEVEVMCDSYKILGFEKIDLVGVDGERGCLVGETCPCEDAAP